MDLLCVFDFFFHFIEKFPTTFTSYCVTEFNNRSSNRSNSSNKSNDNNKCKYLIDNKNHVSYEIKCKKCYSIIYPVDWTDDIERVYEYYNKLVVPERSALRFTTLFFVLVLLFLGLIGAGTYLYLEGFI